MVNTVLIYAHTCTVRTVVISFPTTKNLHNLNNSFSHVELNYFPPYKIDILIITLTKKFFVLEFIKLSTVKKIGRQRYNLRATSESFHNCFRKASASLPKRDSRCLPAHSDAGSRVGKLRQPTTLSIRPIQMQSLHYQLLTGRAPGLFHIIPYEN